MDRESMQLLSLRLSRVLEDIGVSRYIRTRRRRTWMMKETIMTITDEIQSHKANLYHFGSQTEGTTTLGMKSDIDALYCLNDWPIILDWSEWKQGKRNLLVVKTENSPPQHCWLQWVRPNIPLPETQVRETDGMVDTEGRVLKVNTDVELCGLIRTLAESEEMFSNGPSKSWEKINDHVTAYRCANLPEECKFLFNRPRPGHWPRPDTLAQARQTGVFLVPQGYTEDPSRPIRCKSTTFHVPYEYPSYPLLKREWRFSTSLMERLLIFDMNTVQHKVYVLLKVLRKSYTKLIVDDRFSTFHIKTAMLFTIETYPPDIWREDNLVQCVICCLTTLHRWLKIKYCPHFTISGVNLFTGKLFKHEQNILLIMISEIINDNNFQCLFSIKMDRLGRRLSSVCCISAHVKSRRVLIESQKMELLIRYELELFNKFNGILFDKQECLDQTLPTYLNIMMLKSEIGSDLEQEAVSLLIPLLCGSLASIQASRCLSNDQPVTQDIIHLYRRSFDSDLLSSRLKFASMLYCSGQYETAANCLSYCEGLLGPEVWQYCECLGREKTMPSNDFLEKVVDMPFKDLLQKYTAYHVVFINRDIECVPQHLRYEMFRTIVDEDRQQRRLAYLYTWMDYILINSIPFLHYLQYLTYRQLHQHPSKLEALNNLNVYISSGQSHDHIDTDWNMLGHCYELENRLDLAWHCYTQSLKLFPRNNAANWHIARMVHNQLIKHLS